VSSAVSLALATNAISTRSVASSKRASSATVWAVAEQARRSLLAEGSFYERIRGRGGHHPVQREAS
jgi:hypothetical protein